MTVSIIEFKSHFQMLIPKTGFNCLFQSVILNGRYCRGGSRFQQKFFGTHEQVQRNFAIST